MIDILFAAVPYIDNAEPIMAPGLLKAVATAEGFSSVALDLKIEIYRRLQKHPSKTKLEQSFQIRHIDHEIAEELHEIIALCGDKILDHHPRLVGLSLLTHHSQVFSVWLALYLKLTRPDIKIIIGGSGIKDFIAAHKNNFCEELKKLGLIDHYIMGDGEIALKEFLHGNLTYPGIDTPNWIQPTDISNFPWPDYSDYDFDQYIQRAIPMSDSRGCVRTCEFCDIIEHWKKYVYRSADDLFNEMLHQIEKHKILNFSMRNSLTHGNVKEFNRWLDQILEYNKGKPKQKQIFWDGYFIIREPHQHPEELWSKLQKTNGTLVLGVESVIHHVRWEMRKKFSNEAIDYHLEMGQKYQVPLRLLLIVGSPSETLADYEFTKQWFQDRTDYAGNSITHVQLSLAAILPGTEWDRKQKTFEIVPGNLPSSWSKKTITPEYRIQYLTELLEICQSFSHTNLRKPDGGQRPVIDIMMQ